MSKSQPRHHESMVRRAGGIRSLSAAKAQLLSGVLARKATRPWTTDETNDWTVITPAVEELEVQCWCQQTIILVPQEFVRAGLTFACKRPKCRRIEDHEVPR